MRVNQSMREIDCVVHGAAVQNAFGRLRPVAMALLAANMLSACAMSVPIPGLSLDDGPTGTLKQVDASPFSAEMDGEDWRRAKSALDTALDPQGNGAQVAWDNPKSGAKGTFIPLAQPYPKDDGICRTFTARIETQGQGPRLLRSSACRRNGGEWIIGKITPADSKSVPDTRPPKKLAERDTSNHLN